MEINVSPEVLRAKYNEIVEVDDQLAAASGGANAGKRAIANRLAAENEEAINNLVSQIAEVFEQLDEPTLAGVFSGFTKQLDAKFNEPVQAFLTREAEANKTEVPQLSDDDMKKLVETAKTLRNEYTALRNILDLFGQDISDIPLPKKMTGARGKRGKRVLSTYIYSVDGDKLPDLEQGSLAAVAKRIGVEGYETEVTDKEGNVTGTKNVTSATQLKEMLAEKGLDLKEPEDTWSYNINGHVVSAVRMAVDDDDDDASDEEDDSNE